MPKRTPAMGTLWVLPQGIFSQDLQRLFALSPHVGLRLRAFLCQHAPLCASDGDVRDLTEVIVFLAQSADLEAKKLGLYEFLRAVVKTGAMDLTLGVPEGPDDNGGGGLPHSAPRRGSFFYSAAWLASC
jgi:hypothetical protein